MRRIAAALLFLGLVGSGTLARPVPTRAASAPHILLVMLENKGYQKTLGTCSADPYLCSLAKSYASVTGWVGIGHPSLPNYLAIVSGSTQGCTSDSCPTGKYRGDLMAQLLAASIPFALYMESMPGACASKDHGLYVVHHNPGPYFTDANCSTTDVPYPGAKGLVTALDNGSAGDFVWITPNVDDDMHSASVQAGDKWLQANLSGVLTSSWFASGGTVIVTMDEGPKNNAVPMVIVSANAKGMGTVNRPGDHYGTLRSLETAYSLAPLGKAAGATDLSSLFG